MACGCPVICSSIPALEERCGDAAIYCDARRSDSIAGAIRSLHADEDLRATLRSRGYNRVRQFTWMNCARDTLNLIADYAGKA